MDSSQHHEPQRLSALYQYHNAPEVAPAHGLEYDDTIYPSSDKYPVISERMYDLKGKYGFAGDNRPPRIIFGMKVRTFLVVALIMVLIIVGAAVGGAVGGKQLREDQENQLSTNTTAATGTPSSATATSTFVAATPTYTPLSDCPDSNNTTYTSSYNQTSSSTSQASNAGLHFTKYCDLQNPLSSTGSARIAEAFVYSFSDCVEVCAGYNYWNDNSNCTVAVYEPAGSRPGNCWVGNAGDVDVASLNTTTGTDVAVLLS